MILAVALLLTGALIQDPKETNLLDIPTQYQGDTYAAIVTGPQKFVDKHCGKASEGYHTIGCSVAANRILYLPNPCTFREAKDPNSYAHLMCHELAHINGWHHVNE